MSVHLIAPDVKRRMAEEDAKRAAFIEQMRRELAESLTHIASGLAYPRIARADLERAQVHLVRALSIATALDPKEAA